MLSPCLSCRKVKKQMEDRVNKAVEVPLNISFGFIAQLPRISGVPARIVFDVSRKLLRSWPGPS